MNDAAASAHRRGTAIVIAAVALLTISVAGILTIPSEPGEGVSLLLAYAGGMAMLLTP